MSIIYYEQHDLKWDSDRKDECPACENEPTQSTEENMTKSGLQIASDIVEACPYTKNWTSAPKLLLAAMFAEELSKQRQEGYAAGCRDTVGVLPGPILNTRRGET